MYSKILSSPHLLVPTISTILVSIIHENRSKCYKWTPDKEDFYFYNYFPRKELYQPKVPYPAWDDNWDGKESDSSETGITRHILLVRHGQYDESHKEEEDHRRVLTPLGKQQAHLTGKRLAEMIRGHGTLYKACPVTTIVSSDMTRAKETAAIIARYLPRSVIRSEPDSLLNEGIPAQIIPTRPELNIQQNLNENRKRIEAAFQKYIFRNTEKHTEDHPESSERHEFEVIVCHGNVIRYFFCRALQLPPEAWLRMSTYNCSLTYLLIKPNGRVSARMMGDIGHLPYYKTSFSMHHGFIP